MSTERPIDLAVWFWDRFHQRGYFSHRFRATKLQHVPMPCTGDEVAWHQCAKLQSQCCLSLRKLHGLAYLASDHFALVTDPNRVAERDEAWWAACAPSGSYSPLGTAAALRAIDHACKEVIDKGKWRGLAVPYAAATLREITALSLSVAFLLLPSVYPIRCLWLHIPINPVVGIVSALACAIGFKTAYREFHRLL